MKNLEKLLELRNNISKLQFEIEGLMPEAVGEAMEVLGTRENTKNKTVYQCQKGKENDSKTLVGGFLVSRKGGKLDHRYLAKRQMYTN